MNDFVIPIVFPEYIITIEGQGFQGLGHAGVVIVDGSTGLTKYYEFGRYPGSNGLGKVQNEPILNLTITDGKIDGSSLKDMLDLTCSPFLYQRKLESQNRRYTL